MFPIDIRRVPGLTNDAFGWDTKVKGRPDCSSILDSNLMDFQKNYHIFDVEKDGHMDTYMEIHPHGSSMRKVLFNADKFHKIGDWELVLNGTFGYWGTNKHRSMDDLIIHKESDFPKDQWKYPSPEKTAWKGGTTLPHGTACCIDVAWGNNESIKVGISHGVSKAECGYVSRFYAFETKSSWFQSVAMSGPFCLGRKAQTDINAETQIFPFPEKNLILGNETYDCPHVTFASGLLVDYQADTNYAVLSYGVNDSYSRSIVISKKRIVAFLNLNNTVLEKQG
eukprot:scaffold128086_cov46-Attheya_sp.AAC.2